MYTDQLIIIVGIKLEDIIKAKPEMIYWSASTAWWTHDKNDICYVPPTLPKHLPAEDMKKAKELLERVSNSTYKLPTDPSGAALFQTDDWKGFIGEAIRKKEIHGKHKLNAFMAAHHQNCFTVNPDKQTEMIHACFRKWDVYNAAYEKFLLERKDQYTDLVGNIKNWRNEKSN